MEAVFYLEILARENCGENSCVDNSVAQSKKFSPKIFGETTNLPSSISPTP